MELCLLGSNIDWEITKDVVAMFISALSAIAAFGAVFVAFRGLTTWRQQLIGTEKHRLAQAFFRAAFEFRARFNEVRHPTFLTKEILENDGEFSSLKEKYPQRFESLQQARLKLEESAFEVQVSLMFEKDEIDRLIRNFLNIQYELLVAVEDYVDGKRTNDLLFVVYKPVRSEKDLIGKRLDELVNQVQDLSKPFLK
ncbi:MAG: hypothetical protein ACRC02_18205 [Vogesella sp.]|uniref:hypothetical protein n=1 Tax=Vogesella sp. TaxID=1904252 RepID=UPI003F2FA144